MVQRKKQGAEQLAVFKARWIALSKEQRCSMLTFEDVATVEALRGHVRRLCEVERLQGKARPRPEDSEGPYTLLLLRNLQLLGQILRGYRALCVSADLAGEERLLEELEALEPGSFLQGELPRGAQMALQRSVPKSWDELQRLVLKLIEQQLLRRLISGNCPASTRPRFGEGFISVLEEAFLPQLPAEECAPLPLNASPPPEQKQKPQSRKARHRRKRSKQKVATVVVTKLRESSVDVPDNDCTHSETNGSDCEDDSVSSDEQSDLDSEEVRKHSKGQETSSSEMDMLEEAEGIRSQSDSLPDPDKNPGNCSGSSPSEVESANAIGITMSDNSTPHGSEELRVDEADARSELTFSSSSSKSEQSRDRHSSDVLSADPALTATNEAGWTVATSVRHQRLAAADQHADQHAASTPPQPSMPPRRNRSEDVLSTIFSSAGSQKEDHVEVMDTEQSRAFTRHAEASCTSFSLMDSLNLKLEAALSELKFGRLKSCEGIIQGTLQFFGGLEPYLQSNNRKMSEEWQRLARRTAEVDWRHHYEVGNTIHLYHQGMSSSPLMVNTLQFLCRITNATHVLEVGTFTGLGALGMAEVLPRSASILTLEQDPFLADFARQELRCSPRSTNVTVVCCDALSALRRMSNSAGVPQFELIFIDGCKTEYKSYIEAIHKQDLLAPSGVIVIDDVLWKGGVYEPFACETLKRASEEAQEVHSESPWPAKLPDNEVASVMASLNDWIAHDPRFESLTLPLHNGITLIQHAKSVDAKPIELPPGALHAPYPAPSERSLSTHSVSTTDELDSSLGERQRSAPPYLPPFCSASAAPMRLPAYLGKPRHASRTLLRDDFSTGGLDMHRRQTSAPASLRALSESMARQITPSTRKGSFNCPTPTQLWPSTPESTPRLIPMMEPAFIAPMTL
eukprot:TRINITY_DN23547_c0_g1_i1.p1 TRINITY_DN23547_c0_g1~~TRINITY_DN23547_c0_g1_i1.p1  ORF type:complete len:920 (-),score=174.60 TRINITY_DN23547_c0_g1_i1:26-2755(-)